MLCYAITELLCYLNILYNVLLVVFISIFFHILFECFSQL